MNTLQVFNFEKKEIRTMLINDEPWFVGKDVAEVLGYKKTENAIANHVDEEDKTTTLLQGSGSNYKSKTVIINESGLYSLVLSSKLPSAKKFKRWVTSEVLPSLRKTGKYSINEMDSKELLARAVIESQRIIEEKDRQIEEMKPKASYYDTILNCKELMSISLIAKDYGWSAQKLNKYLHEKRIQYKQSGTWLLYKDYAKNGFVSSKTLKTTDRNGVEHAHINTQWTQKGRLFIYDLLKKDGIVPLIERGEENE